MVESISKKLQFQHLFLENPMGIAGGLALMWHEEVTLKVKDNSKQFIDVECTDPVSKYVMQITFVHASTNFGERLLLWQTLKALKPRSSTPWICMGDFNEILYVWEKVGKREADNKRIVAFRDMLNEPSLINIDSHGCTYTWANNREGEDLVKKKIRQGVMHFGMANYLS